MADRHAVGRAILLMMGGIILQTTIVTRLQEPFFGFAPNLVVVLAILSARWLHPRAALLLGFTAGLFLDLLGGGILGLRALVLTTVAYAAVRMTSELPLRSIAGVWPISLLAEVVLFVVGTLAGRGTLLQAELLQRAIAVPLLNVVLAAVLFPLLARVLKPRERRMPL